MSRSGKAWASARLSPSALCLPYALGCARRWPWEPLRWAFVKSSPWVSKFGGCNWATLLPMCFCLPWGVWHRATNGLIGWSAQARRWLWVSLACIPLLFLSAALAGALAGKPVNFNGGLGMPAVVYAFWEPFVAWRLIAWLLVSFRAQFNSPSPRWERWASQAYGAFILHAPVLVGISVGISGLAAPAALKFVVVGGASITISFALTRIVLKLPLARKVL